ncbi:Protein IN2-1-like protein B [Bienertia sinuspersici]
MLAYAGTFSGAAVSHLKGGPEPNSDMIAAFDKLEEALSKFDDGPFFLGQFSAVDIAFITFVERFQPLTLELKNYDITYGRPKLAAWIEELNKIDAYKQTKYQQELGQVVSSLMPLKGGLGFEPRRMQKTLVGRLTHQS